MDPAVATRRFLLLGLGALLLSLLALIPGAPAFLQVPFGLVFSGALALILLAPAAMQDGRPWLESAAGALAGATAGSLATLARTLARWGDPSFSQPIAEHLLAMVALALVSVGAAVWFLARHGRASGIVFLATLVVAAAVVVVPALYGWALLATHLALVVGLLPLRRTRVELGRAAGVGATLLLASLLAVAALDGQVRKRGIIMGDAGAAALLGGVLAASGCALVALLFWREDGWRVRGLTGEP